MAHPRARVPQDDAGLPGFEVLSWQGLFAPAGTPPADISYTFESFEALGALAHLEEIDEQSLQQSLSTHDGKVRMSIGRIGWHENSRDRFIQEFSDTPVRDELLKAGFAKGSSTYWISTCSI